ncbi:uncharacterized protein LOC141652158 [Silene latifolia]|uniref:uncharacterized protein LOC141652158 n=1 Tax=Silene latifolia TaxID=37657 RepID=UPI003D7762EF
MIIIGGMTNQSRNMLLGRSPVTQEMSTSLGGVKRVTHSVRRCGITLRHIRSIDFEYDPVPEWQSRVTRRITTLINGLKYNKKPPKWVPVTWLENLKNRPNDPTFAKHSKINTANRKSGGKDGKALGTHTLGRKSCSDAFKELGQEATPPQDVHEDEEK